MPRMTHAEWLAYEQRRSKVVVNSDGVDDETELHNAILEECKTRGWLPFHGSMAHRTYRTEGEPDFIIFADCGRVVAIECKRRRGKLSTAQLGIIAWAEKLGHKIHVITSIEEFREIVK